jgi:hypothetical protein
MGQLAFGQRIAGLSAQPVRGHRGVIDGAGLRYRLVTLPAGGDSRRPGDPSRRLPFLVWYVASAPAGNSAPVAAVVAERAAARQAAASPRCPADGLSPAVPDMRMSQSSRSSPGRRPSVIDSTNSASSLREVSVSSSRPSCSRQKRQVVAARSVPISVTGAPSRVHVPHASAPVSVAAWVAAYLPWLTFMTLTKPADWPLAALATVMASRDVTA